MTASSVPDVTGDVERQPEAPEIPPEKRARQNEVSGARHRQELTESLNDAKQSRRQQIQSGPRLRCFAAACRLLGGCHRTRARLLAAQENRNRRGDEHRRVGAADDARPAS